MAEPANTTPVRALARLMIAAFTAVLMTLFILVAMVGVGDPVESSGASTTAAVAGP